MLSIKTLWLQWSEKRRRVCFDFCFFLLCLFKTCFVCSGKITALDAENQIKKAGADYDICEAECKKAIRSAIESAQTCTILISCNYLSAYSKFWDAGAKMGSLLLATAGKHRQVRK